MPSDEPRILLENLGLPEGPRWGRGRLFFSDVYAGEVVAVDLAGRREAIGLAPKRPNGLGWLPDGRLLAVSTQDRRLLVETSGGLTEIADLTPFTHDLSIDMAVDAQGHAYVGDYRNPPGADPLEKLANPLGANLVLVDFSGDPARPLVRVVAGDMHVPNGMLVLPDGRTLIVAETAGYRLTAFTIAPDGSLSDRRVWAELDIAPDGIALDREGRIWVATPFPPPSQFQLVEEGGRVIDRILLPDSAAFSCAFGGPDMSTLFLCEATYPTRPTKRLGRIRTVRVKVPGWLA
jgi:sugar lactone lactonase YvrE